MFRRMRRGRCQQLVGQPRRDDEGNGQREQHAHRRVDRNRAHVGAHQAADEGHRQQRRDHRKRGEYGRAADFVHRLRNDLPQRLAGFQRLPAVDVLDHHDCVVDQNADREDQREQRHPVEREAPGPRGEQGCRKGQCHRHADDQRFAPAECQPDQRDHGGGGEDQLADQLLRLVGGGGAIVARDGEFDTGRDDRALERFGALDDRFSHVGRIDARLLRHRQRHRRILGAGLFLRRRLADAMPDVAAGLVRAVLDLRDVGHEHRLAVGHADDQFAHIVGRLEIGAGLHQHLAVARNDLAGRLRGIGYLQRGADVLRGNAVRSHALGVHQHADHVAGPAYGRHVARAVEALDLESRWRVPPVAGRTRRAPGRPSRRSG